MTVESISKLQSPVHASYEVVRLEQQYFTRVFQFLQQAYPDQPRKTDPHRWSWQYVRNPLRGEGPLDTWVCCQASGRVIGQRPTMPAQLSIRGMLYRINWGVDFIVLPEMRGQGVGRELMMEVMRQVQIYGAIDSSPGAQRIYKQLGLCSLGEVLRFVYPLAPGALLSRRLGTLGRVLAPLFELVWRSFHRSRRRAADVILSAVSEFDEEFDDLWQAMTSCYSIIAQRDASYLNWRYIEAPARYSCWAARGSGGLRGYIVLGYEAELRRVYVADILAAPNDQTTLGLLLAQSIAWAKQQGAVALDAYTLHVTLQQALRRAGFLCRRRPGLSFWVGTQLTGPERGLLCDPTQWYATAIDGDIDPIFHDPVFH